MSKFEMASIVEALKKKYQKENPEYVTKIGLGSDLKVMDESNFIVMPEWWRKATNTPGIPFGGVVMIAGDSDSGKTSAAIEAMKSAQEQGYAVIYVETENKTTTKDLIMWEVDPDGVILVQAKVAEEAFDLLCDAWDAFRGKNPEAKILIVFDSIGNILSKRDAEINLAESAAKPGGKGQINRMGINKIIAKADDDNAALLLINYTYDNIGSPGKTNAGGKALNFFSSLTYQTSRKKWLERQVNGQKVRYGAEVVWKLFKNHIQKNQPGMKEFTLRITADGISLADGAEE